MRVVCASAEWENFGVLEILKDGVCALVNHV